MDFDSVTVDLIKGMPVLSLRPTLEVWQRSGLNSYGAREMQLGEGECQLRAVKYCTGATKPDALTAANTFIDAMVALQATIISMTDQYGRPIDDVLVVKVDEAASAMNYVKHKGLECFRVELPLTLLKT